MRTRSMTRAGARQVPSLLDLPDNVLSNIAQRVGCSVRQVCKPLKDAYGCLHALQLHGIPTPDQLHAALAIYQHHPEIHTLDLRHVGRHVSSATIQQISLAFPRLRSITIHRHPRPGGTLPRLLNAFGQLTKLELQSFHDMQPAPFNRLVAGCSALTSLRHLSITLDLQHRDPEAADTADNTLAQLSHLQHLTHFGAFILKEHADNAWLDTDSWLVATGSLPQLRSLKLAGNLQVQGLHQAELLQSHTQLIALTVTCGLCPPAAGNDATSRYESLDAVCNIATRLRRLRLTADIHQPQHAGIVQECIDRLQAVDALELFLHPSNVPRMMGASPVLPNLSSLAVGGGGGQGAGASGPAAASSSHSSPSPSPSHSSRFACVGAPGSSSAQLGCWDGLQTLHLHVKHNWRCRISGRYPGYSMTALQPLQQVAHQLRSFKLCQSDSEPAVMQFVLTFMTRLTELSLEGKWFDPQQLELPAVPTNMHLSALAQLERLSLASHNVEWVLQDMAQLATLTRLTGLSLRRWGLDTRWPVCPDGYTLVKAVLQLSAVAPQLQSLQLLDMSRCWLTPLNRLGLLEGLAGLKQLKELGIDKHDVHAVKPLLDLLRPNLQRLWVGRMLCSTFPNAQLHIERICELQPDASCEMLPEGCGKVWWGSHDMGAHLSSGLHD